MALNTSKCNHMTPLPFKGLINIALSQLMWHSLRVRRSSLFRWF